MQSTIDHYTLLHAALATTSPDILTLRSQPPQLILPPELILQILQHHLLPSVLSSLHAQSTHALHQHELALSRRLCAECRGYQEEVYGTSVWVWKQRKCTCLYLSVSCACARRRTLNSGVKACRETNKNENENEKGKEEEEEKEGEEEYKSKEEWLESYLSRDLPEPIQTLLSSVLSSLGCHLMPTTTTQPPLECTYTPHDTTADAYTQTTTLRRVRRELGLDYTFDHSPPPIAYTEEKSAPSRRGERCSSCRPTRALLTTAADVSLHAFAGVCSVVFFPLTVALIWWRPRAFRLF